MFGKRSNASLAEEMPPRPPRPVAAPTPAPAPKPEAKSDATPKVNGATAGPAAGQKAEPIAAPKPATPPPPKTSENVVMAERSEDYYELKRSVFDALIDTIDLAQLAQLDAKSAGEEIRDIVSEIITIKNVVLSTAEQEQLVEDICNDVLGYGPLEPLLARDDIADIMVNGADRCFIEVGGKIQLTPIRFRDNAQLMNICQRIVSQIGRRVDESSPICDARLLDGSRVNVIAPPLAIDGPALTIRKFKKDKLTLDNLVNFVRLRRMVPRC